MEPELVRGTQHQGFACYTALEHSLARAVMMMFIVIEVHPFDDGNGRLARIMANAELVRRGLSRLIITTSYRQDYLRALCRLSRQRARGCTCACWTGRRPSRRTAPGLLRGPERAANQRAGVQRGRRRNGVVAASLTLLITISCGSAFSP